MKFTSKSKRKPVFLTLTFVFFSGETFAQNQYLQGYTSRKNPNENAYFYKDLRRIEESPHSHEESADLEEAEHENALAEYLPHRQKKHQYMSEKVLSKGRKSLQPRAEINHRYSNDRAITMSEFWVPLAQDEDGNSVFFGDVRFMGDNNDNREFNIGAGHRTIINDAVIGGIVWYDRSLTDRGSKFNQITAGAEYLDERFDIRANAYYPLNNKKTHEQAHSDGPGKGFVGNQILVNTDQTVVEEALPGADLEIGYRLKSLDRITDSTRLYAGVYHFEGDRAEDVSGFSSRIASDITSDVQLGARYQHDDIRGSQAYVEATVRFPFGHKKSFQEDGIRSRLDERPERDIDIVSNEVVIDSGLNNTPILNASTGLAQNVIHVNNTNEGVENGSAERPFNTLAEAEAAAGANDLIYVHRGNGTTSGMDAGIIIDDPGQMLIGSGTNLALDNNRLNLPSGTRLNRPVVAASLAPNITNASGNGINVSADDVFISGLNVTGSSGHNLFADSSDNLIIFDNEFSNASANGALITHSLAGSYDLLVSKNKFTSNTVHGLQISNSGSGSIISLVSKNFTALNGTDGMEVSNGTFSNNPGGSHEISFVDNEYHKNGRFGAYVNSLGGSRVMNINFSENLVSENVGTGLFVTTYNSADSYVIFDKNFLSDNGGGLAVRSRDAGDTYANFSENTIERSGRGILVNAVGAGQSDAKIFKNIIKENDVGINTLISSSQVSIIDAGGGNLESSGNNIIVDSANAALQIDLDGGTLAAQNNFWGDPLGLSPDDVTLIDGSSYNASNPLRFDPRK